jgi:CheY-like chemotaxis protein
MNTFYTTTENRRWMLVDDSEQILCLMANLAGRMTSAVIECYNSPQSALAAFAAAPGKYELVITDLDMPEMDGVKLCRQMREISLMLNIFLATGSDFFSEAAAAHAGFSGLLKKPFPADRLHETLAEAGVEVGLPLSA